MQALKCILLISVWTATHAQQYQTTTPVPILKQINRQNDDGSYSYGYEAADGSFKIETKYPNGDVAGKYGYVDEAGKTREISYGASSKRGFEPQGTGIMVPPPTLNDHPTNALTDGQEDDGQYREDPKIYEDPKYNSRSQKSRPAPAQFRQFHQPARPEPQQYQQEFQTQQYQPQQYQPQQIQPQQYQPQQFQPQQFQNQQQFSGPLYTQQTSLNNQYQPQFNQLRPQSQIYHQQPQFSYQAFTQQPQAYQGFPQNYNPYSGHPAQNIDPNTGSYTINFTG